VPKVLLGISSCRPAQGGTVYCPIGYQTGNRFIYDENLAKTPLRAGTLRKLTFYVGSVYGTGEYSTITIRKNNTDTALSITTTAGGTGIFQDLDHEVTIADGDQISVSMTGSSAPYDTRIDTLTVEYEAGGDYPVTQFCADPLGDTASSSSTTGENYVPFGYGTGAQTTESSAQLRLRAPGTLEHLQVLINSNTKTVDTKLYLRKNGTDSAVNITIPAGTTGIFYDDSHTEEVAGGDLVNLRYDGVGGSGALNWSYASIRFVGSGKKWDAFARTDTNAWNLHDFVEYSCSFGSGEPTASENRTTSYFLFDTVASNLRVYIKSGIYGTTAMTFRLRINGADGNMAVTPPLGTTGWFENVEDHDQILAGDIVNLTKSAASTNLGGTITYWAATYFAGVIIDAGVHPGTGEIQVVGLAQTIRQDAICAPTAGVVETSGPSPHIAATWHVRPPKGLLIATGLSATVNHSGSVTPGAGDLRISSSSPIVNDVVASHLSVLAMVEETPSEFASGQAILAVGEIVPNVKASGETVLVAAEIIPGVTISSEALLVLAAGERSTSMRCQLWRITRKDGEVFCYTSLDMDFPWGGQNFEACQSLNPSAVEEQSVLGSTGNIELEGIITSDRITEADLYGGKFDDCFVEVWLANYNPDVQECPKRIAAGWAGDLSHGEKGFKMEVLGPGSRLDQQALVQSVAPSCRWNLGDGNCPYDREAAKLTGVVSIKKTRLIWNATITGSAGSLQWENGLVRWTSGENTGLECEVKTVDFDTGLITLWALPYYAPVVGDAFDLLPGCDRSADTCKDIYDQLLDFGGYPDVPGTDSIAETTDATS